MEPHHTILSFNTLLLILILIILYYVYKINKTVQTAKSAVQHAMPVYQQY